MSRKPSARKAVELSAADQLLIDVLAKTDALFAPYRFDGGRHAPGSIWTRRTRFALDGIVTAGGETDATTRKQRSRMIAELTAAGMLSRSRPGAHPRHTTHADGRHCLGAICELPDLDTGFQIMRQTAAIGRTGNATIDACPATAARPLIREYFLLGCDGWREDDDFETLVIGLENDLAPALWRGYVESHSDGKRRVHYQLTEAGLAILQDDRADERAALLHCPATIRANNQAAELYWETYKAEFVARRDWSDESAQNELGYIPLSCSLPTAGELAAIRRERAERDGRGAMSEETDLLVKDILDGQRSVHSALVDEITAVDDNSVRPVGKPIGAQSSSYRRRAAKRAYENLLFQRAAEKQIGRMPDPAETIHMVVSAAFRTVDLLPAWLAFKAHAIEQLFVATLSYSRDNLDTILELHDRGQVKDFALVLSVYFRANEPDLFAYSKEQLHKRGCRLVACQNHCKVIAAQFADGTAYVAEGSANLRSHSTTENIALTNDAALFAFHKAWMEQLLSSPDKEPTMPAVPKAPRRGYSQRRAGLGVLTCTRDKGSRRRILAWKTAAQEIPQETAEFAAALAALIDEALPVRPASPSPCRRKCAALRERTTPACLPATWPRASTCRLWRSSPAPTKRSFTAPPQA